MSGLNRPDREDPLVVDENQWIAAARAALAAAQKREMFLAAIETEVERSHVRIRNTSAAAFITSATLTKGRV
ncbi:hypothetical protein GVX82_04055 [Patescibacteria group bacterium]|jgi:hypothetical protein|nr:hypothetical protein [Patescibacteria group bacterium]